MFELPDSKTFMDTVHGYIYIPKVFVEYIVDTVWFQRLRYIDQTGMKILYPNGKHDRFCHSLGVYYLGLKAVDTLLEHFKTQIYWNIRSDKTCDAFWAKNKVLFLIACLLHDIGHAPFSHSLESIVLDNSERVNMKLVEYINKLEKNPEEVVLAQDINAAPHERMGALLVIEVFKSNISDILNYLQKNNYPIKNMTSYAEYAKLTPPIDSSEIDVDIAFIVRMIMGLKYKSFRPESQIRNCIMGLLNGNDFDVDKLDYIIRDTKMSGISNTSLDVERLLGSLTLVTTTECKNLTFNGQNGNFQTRVLIRKLETSEEQTLTVTGMIDGIFHLKGNSKITIAPGESFLSLKAPKDLSDENRSIAKLKLISAVTFDAKTEFYVNNQENRSLPNTYDKKGIVWSETGSPHTVTIKNATILADPFQFEIVENGLLDLELKGCCTLTIAGAVTMDSAWMKGIFTGTCSKLMVVDDLLKRRDCLPTPNEYNGFTIGFKKQAINLISNVLDARDYLYLWIYAHHKVVYYANFLIPELSKMVSRIILELEGESFPVWKLDYNNIKMLDDNYLMTAMKYIEEFQADKLTLREKKMLSELFHRKYKRSLYKSLAEYDILFSDFTLIQQQEIRRSLVGISQKGNVQEEKMTYGFFKSDIIEYIGKNANIDLDYVENLVWVDSNYRSKKLHFEDTFCVFQDKTVTMGNLSLLSAPFQNKPTNHYFYVYYEVKEGMEDQPGLLKTALILYFEKQLI